MSKKQFAAMVAVALVGGLLGATARDLLRGQPAYAQVTQTGAGSIEAQQFRLVSADGTLRAALGPEASLNLYDGSGHTRAALVLAGDGTPTLGLFDGGANVRFWISLQGDGRPGVVLRNDGLKAGVLLHTLPDGSGELCLLDEAERIRMILGQDEDKKWGVSVRDTGGTTTWKAP
jgi:hypothetical protein